jgi:serine/threonine-protein kinase
MFGPYEILGRLGSGGMGLVFRAWDERLHREVAIKLVRDGYRVPGTRERFLQEARAASRLNHPNICTIFDIGEKDGDPYLVMELLEGETLKERIGKGALTAEQIILRAREIGEALSAAHSKGIVHRDIKPANIFLVRNPNGSSQAKVLDFGLAKVGRREQGKAFDSPDTVERPTRLDDVPLDITSAGATVGTVAYMSPEQARGHALDARSDLFSLGVVMYEMATRRTPFRGTTSTQVFVQLLEHDPDPVRNWNESIPRELERIILRLLAKDRRERFQSARDLNTALEKAAGKLHRSIWLRRSAPAPVPLVRSVEPVARQRRPVKRDSASGMSTNALGSRPGANTVIRPLRVVQDLPEVSADNILHSDRQGAVVMATGSSVGEAKASSGVRSAPALARSRSGVTQFEYGIDDVLEPENIATGRMGLEGATRPRRRIARVVMAATVLIATIGAAALLVIGSGRLRPVILGPNDVLLLTEVQDKTGEGGLGDAVRGGLEIALEKSRFLNVRGADAYQAALQQFRQADSNPAQKPSARMVAQRVGAKAYLYGEIRGTAPYEISVDVIESSSNDKLAHVREQSATRDQIPAAIDRLARALRAEMGEGTNTIGEPSDSLDREVPRSVDALSAYSIAQAAVQSGRIADALKAYQQAVGRDERFTQAQIGLAWLYQAQNAEIAAAESAERALAASRDADEKTRLLAEFCYEMIVAGDTRRAAATIHRYTEQFPRDVNGMVGLAKVMRAQGHLVEALLAAQQAIGGDPFRAEAYAEAELALIGLDRYDAALQLESQTRQLGVAPSGLRLAAAYLANRTDVIAQETHAVQGQTATHQQQLPAALARYGSYLDNSGQMGSGGAVWRDESLPELSSARAFLLAQSALDRALAGDCASALNLIHESSGLSRGPATQFRNGMASALCSENAEAEQAIAGLEQLSSGTTATTRYSPAELRAALMIADRNPAAALDLMAEVEPQDELLLLPYLRALAYVSLGKPKQAIPYFEAVTTHRGAAFLGGTNVYSLAQLGLARALEVSGDQAAGATTYRGFLALSRAAK